jgi:hypothetical protein
MNDDELKMQLRAEVPAPRPGYWATIDAALADVATEGDTDRPIIRLKTMNTIAANPTHTPHTAWRVIGVAAAVSAIAAGGYGLTQRFKAESDPPAAPPTVVPTTPGTNPTSATPAPYPRTCYVGDADTAPGLYVVLETHDDGTAIAGTLRGDGAPQQIEYATGTSGTGGDYTMRVVPVQGAGDARTETWNLTATAVSIGETAGAQTADCATMTAQVKSIDDAVAAAPRGPDGSITGQARAFRIDKAVTFAAGANTADESNAVVRGEADRYRLMARAGQTLKVAVTAAESNAVVEVVAPDGSTLVTEVTQQDITLPADGEYSVIVSGSRGNATYKLSITIV